MLHFGLKTLIDEYELYIKILFYYYWYGLVWDLLAIYPKGAIYFDEKENFGEVVFRLSFRVKNRRIITNRYIEIELPAESTVIGNIEKYSGKK